MTRRHSLLIVAVACAFVVGCGGGPVTKTVTGKVTYQNQPVETGQLIFRDAAGLPQVAPIDGGEYTADVTPGPKTVEITGLKDTGQTDALGGPLRQQFLPPKYNAQTTLQVEVADSGENVHNFELQ